MRRTREPFIRHCSLVSEFLSVSWMRLKLGSKGARKRKRPRVRESQLLASGMGRPLGKRTLTNAGTIGGASTGGTAAPAGMAWAQALRGTLLFWSVPTEFSNLGASFPSPSRGFCKVCYRRCLDLEPLLPPLVS